MTTPLPMATPQYTFLVCLLTRYIYWKFYSMFLWMHMFLKKTHMNGLIRRNGSSQLGFFQRRILPINELMRPVERIRETVSWTSYRDMIVKPRPPSEWKNGECRKGLVKSSGKSKHFGRSITNSSPEKPQNHRSHQSNPLEKKPSAEPGRRKTATASWKPLAPMTKSWQPKELPGEDEGQVVGCGFSISWGWWLVSGCWFQNTF